MSGPEPESHAVREERIVELIKQEICKSAQPVIEPLKPTKLDSKGLQLQADILEEIDRCFQKIQGAI